MKKIAVCLLFFFLSSFTGCKQDEPVSSVSIDLSQSLYVNTMKQDLLCLLLAYPEYITGIEKNADSVYFVMKSGKRILYDDKKTKNFNEKINNADLHDSLEQVYPLNDITELMPEDFDPGRFRVYSLLKDVYGSSQKEVQSKLKNVRMGSRSFLFNSANKAADSLKEVMNELVSLAQNNGKISSYAFPVNGTFNYRVISGTNLLSAHAFGIAIDLASNKDDYWKWTSREAGERRMLSYPREIVRAFEDHGFVWGGKWGHFDILHFEYRPELILKAKYFLNTMSREGTWYGDQFKNDETAKSCIQMIEQALS